MVASQPHSQGIQARRRPLPCAHPRQDDAPPDEACRDEPIGDRINDLHRELLRRGERRRARCVRVTGADEWPNFRPARDASISADSAPVHALARESLACTPAKAPRGVRGRPRRRRRRALNCRARKRLTFPSSSRETECTLPALPPPMNETTLYAGFPSTCTTPSAWLVTLATYIPPCPPPAWLLSSAARSAQATDLVFRSRVCRPRGLGAWWRCWRALGVGRSRGEAGQQPAG